MQTETRQLTKEQYGKVRKDDRNRKSLQGRETRSDVVQQQRIAQQISNPKRERERNGERFCTERERKVWNGMWERRERGEERERSGALLVTGCLQQINQRKK